jgi:hypothetical protein
LVDQAWNQVGKPVFVDFQGKKMAFSIQPDSIKLSENFTPGKGYNLNLGLSGKVNSHPADAAPSRPFPLPKLTENRSTENQLEILIPLRLTYAEIDGLLQENFGNQAIRANKKTVFKPENFKSRPYGEKLGIQMDFIATQETGKEIKGELFLVGLPTYDPEQQVLIFDQVNFHLESDNPKAKTAVALKNHQTTQPKTPISHGRGFGGKPWGNSGAPCLSNSLCRSENHRTRNLSGWVLPYCHRLGSPTEGYG